MKKALRRAHEAALNAVQNALGIVGLRKRVLKCELRLAQWDPEDRKVHADIVHLGKELQPLEGLPARVDELESSLVFMRAQSAQRRNHICKLKEQLQAANELAAGYRKQLRQGERT